MRTTKILTVSDIVKVFDFFIDRKDDVGGDFALALADSHGEPVFFIKTDNCPVSAAEIARHKAFTSARDRQKTSDLAAASKELGFAVSSLGDLRYTGLGGGVPIFTDGDCIGSVAVSGLSQEADEALAFEIAGLITG